MKKMLAVALMLAVSAPVQAEWKWTDAGFVDTDQQQVDPTPNSLTVIPPGFHAHRTTDGKTIVHSDSNFGSAPAHAGVAYPWPKTGFPGDVVPATDTADLNAQFQSCPNGKCPAGSGRAIQTAGGFVSGSIFAPTGFRSNHRPRLFGRVLGGLFRGRRGCN